MSTWMHVLNSIFDFKLCLKDDFWFYIYFSLQTFIKNQLEIDPEPLPQLWIFPNLVTHV